MQDFSPRLLQNKCKIIRDAMAETAAKASNDLHTKNKRYKYANMQMKNTADPASVSEFLARFS